MRGGVADFVERCEDAGQVLRLEPTREQYADIIERAAPTLRGLSPARLDRLYDSTAHDFVLLDNVLDTIEHTGELDAFDEVALFRRALRRYFASESVYAPALKRVAAVAQFDLALPLADLPRPIEPGFPKAVERLTVVMGRPSSLAFVHASAAELVFRALSWSDADVSWIEPARRHLVDFFLAAIGRREGWERDLQQFLRGRLRLADDLTLRQGVLGDPELLERLAAQLPGNSGAQKSRGCDRVGAVHGRIRLDAAA